MRVLSLLAITACVGPQASPCHDGLCPAGLDCVVDTARGSAACGTGFLDGDACLLCVLPTCGNGRLDPGEQCDDGNRTSGDGCPADCSAACGDGLVDSTEKCDPSVAGAAACSADCRSTLSCGDGVTNVAQGEQCDDGNLADGDGCSASCQAEAATWSALAAAPPGRSSPAVAYNRDRGVVVLFGGFGSGGAALTDTWEWDGTSWSQRATIGPPPAVSFGSTMVYDDDLHRSVLFGGLDANGAVAMWEWDGARWTEQGSSSGPQVDSVAMAYDAARRQVVALTSIDDNGDTWTWDGSAWAEVPDARSLAPKRVAPAMAYDPVRGVVVAFGGSIDDQLPLADTWEWNGATWAKQAPAQSPPARLAASMVYDAARARLVLFGGCTGTTSACAPIDDTWEWDGSSWTPRAPALAPDARGQDAMAYDDRHHDTLLFGGSPALADTWTWDGSAWTPVGGAPPARTATAMAYDARHAQTVLFGGIGTGSSAQPLGDTWLWTGTRWQDAAVAGPPARSGHALAYDAAHGVTVLFGGGTDDSPLRDTWLWDGTSWRQTHVGAPPPRRGFAMAYDAAHQDIVLFGGELDQDRTINGVAIDTFVSDTWVWSGASWQDVTGRSVVAPSARGGHAMAYDARRQRVVLYGGTFGPDAKTDTWEWNGSRWVRRLPAQNPGIRDGAEMVYDAARGTVLLTGGAGVDATVWEWDGGSWSPLSVTAGPVGRSAFGWAYDDVAARAVLFSGVDAGGAALGDTWRFDFSSPSEAGEDCDSGFDGNGNGLVGCADPDCAGECALCGDGVCAGAESCRLCPADCGACAECGDFVCDARETCTSCPGDCGACP